MYKNNPICPSCGALTDCLTYKKPRNKALDDKWYRIRRYQCKGERSHCFSTEEVYKNPKPMYVVKKSGETEEFNFKDVMNSIKYASAGEIHDKECMRLTNNITQQLAKKSSTVKKASAAKGRFYASSDVGDIVLSLLFKDGHHKAWVRYSLIFYKKDLGENPNFEKIYSVLCDRRSKILEVVS